MRLRLPTINHRLPTCQPTACVCGLLDRVGDALAEERERLELKAIEMLKGPKRLVQPEPVDLETMPKRIPSSTVVHFTTGDMSLRFTQKMI